MSQGVQSTGRGGAGNIGANPPNRDAADFVTPTIKSDVYTTGRGGSGNMAKNDHFHPEIARARQDLEAPTPKEHDGPSHYGRGGAANVAKSADEDKQPAKTTDQERPNLKNRRQSDTLKEKGKELLEKLGVKK